MRQPKKLFLAHMTINDCEFELYAIFIREEGTTETGEGYLLHEHADIDNDHDMISGGIANVTDPMAIVKLSSWTRDFRIDGNGYYIFVE